MRNDATVRVTLDGKTVASCRIPAADQFAVAANLAYRWYDEIAAGTKKVEHRDLTEYWEGRLFRDKGEDETIPASFIKFTRGYTKKHMTWTVERIDIDLKNRQYHIHLGKQVE